MLKKSKINNKKKYKMFVLSFNASAIFMISVLHLCPTPDIKTKF